MNPKVPPQREGGGGAWISPGQIYAELVSVKERLTALETAVRAQSGPVATGALTRGAAALGMAAAAFAGGWAAVKGG